MVWNSEWEYNNQDTLKDWYQKKISGEEPDLAVRKIICKGCGKAFTPKRSDAVYCSNACRQKAYRQNVADNASSQIENLP